MRITHAFTNPKADGADTTIVRPSDWNADHVVVGEFDTVTELLADTSTYSDYSAGDYLRVVLGGHVYEVAASGASDEHLTTAGGLKLYVMVNSAGNAYDWAAWGPVADGSTDNYAKLRSAGDACRDLDVAGLNFPSGTYYISQEFEVDWIANIQGARGHGSLYGSTSFRFPAGTNGFRLTRGATSTSGDGSDDSVVKYVDLTCVTSSVNSTGHGWVLDARAFLEDCTAEAFPQDGFHVNATATDTPSKNANLWTMIRCRARNNNRYGFYWNGADANAGVGFMCNATGSGLFNFYDSSFLGNTHIGYHSSTPGQKAYCRGSDLKGYRCILDHVATADTIPITGADWATYWEEDAASTSRPVAVVGTKYYESRGGLTGTYPVYHYVSDGDNGECLWITPYAEGASGSNGGGSYFYTNSTILGISLLGLDTGASTPSVEPKTGAQTTMLKWSRLQSTVNVTGVSDTVIASLGGKTNRLAAFSFENDVNDDVWALEWIPADFVWKLRANGSSSAETFSIYEDGNSASRPAGLLDFSTMGFGVGLKRHTASTAAPGTGTWERGDIRYNTTPSLGGNIGWVCTTAGTPGTWAAWGNAVLENTATYDPPSLAAGTVDTIQTMTVTGAALGDLVDASFSLDLQGITLRAWVSATNTVKYVFECAAGGATVDLGSGTVKCRVRK